MPKPYVSELELSSDERRELYRAWREQVAKQQCSALDFLIYALLRGKDPHAGFAPIRNPLKLSNGMQAEQCYRSALLAASNMAGHLLSAKLRALFPTVSADRLGELVGAIWHEATTLYYGQKGV